MSSLLKQAIMAAYTHGFLPFAAVSPLIHFLGLEAS